MSSFYFKLLISFLLTILTNSATFFSHASTVQSEQPQTSFIISHISISKQTFAPSSDESTTISFQLSQPSKVLLQIFDADQQLIGEFMADSPTAHTPFKIKWDGKDLGGNIVPDEAYFFTIEAYGYSGAVAHYDPSTFSGGKNIEFPVHFDNTNQTINYNLSQAARTVIRAGIKQGPMLKNIVNWHPRSKGEHKEPWNGNDNSNVISVVNQKGFTLMAEGITLPENSIFTTGNTNQNFFDYKNTIAPDRPYKQERPKIGDNNSKSIYLKSVKPTYMGVDITFRLALPPETKLNHNGLPIVKGNLPLKIYIDDSIKRYVTEQRYEIICYLDNKFITEQEEGYSPSTWVWDSFSVPNGEHVLTVNVATLTGNLATASVKIYVDN